MTEEEQRIADATATASANCTKDAPQVVDPALWDERGKALMEQLAADEFYQSEGLKYSAKDGCPYMIAVNRAASTVTVLALDDEGNYTKPYMAMVCSGGADTRWDSLQRRSIMTGGCWPGRAMASTLPESGIPICSTLCRITASTRTISSTTSSTSWAPRPAWDVSGCWSVM